MRRYDKRTQTTANGACCFDYRMLQNDLGEVDSQSTPLQFVRERAMIVRQI